MKELRTAADRLDVKFVEESVTSLQAGAKRLDIATLDGVADIPPSAYHRGVDVGVVNYRSDGGELKSGAYTLRITAIDEIRERGHQPAIAEFVGADGQTAARQRIDLDVFSAEIPRERPFDQAAFSLESRFREDMGGGFTPFAIIIGFWCSNGTHGIIILL